MLKWQISNFYNAQKLISRKKSEWQKNYEISTLCKSYQQSFKTECESLKLNFIFSDVKITATDSDAEKCVRCEGKVFDLEKNVAGKSKLVFHKTCFKCSGCKGNLSHSSSDSTRIYAFEPPSSVPQSPGDMYCQRCHLEKFMDQSARPCTWSEVSTIKSEKGTYISANHSYRVSKIKYYFFNWLLL